TMLASQKIDTSSSPLCAAYTATPAVDACVITGHPTTIPPGTTGSVVGARRLTLFATGSITTSGVLDAAGHGKASGPAGGVDPCGANVIDPTSGAPGGGGWGGRA